jgi:hypothetical protein
MHKRLLRLPAFATGAVLVLGLASCGGSASPSSAASATTTPTTTKGGSSASQSAFRDCLSKQGVNLPAGFGNGGPGGPGGNGGPPEGGPPTGGTPGGNPPGSLPAGGGEKFRKALQACGNLAPAGGFRGGGNPNPAALKAYTSCLSDHGVKVPTSTSGSTPARPGGELGALRTDPKFAAANKICRPLLPAFGSTTTTTVPK